MSEKETLILHERVGNVGVIWLNRPPLNLQTLNATAQLEEAISELEADTCVGAVVLAAKSGRVFCAGSDIKEFPALKGNFIEAKIRRENDVFTRLEEMRKPTVAAISGSALGGGAELTLCCDFRVLDEAATFMFPEIRLGNFPGSGAIARLPRLIGEHRARELMSLARSVDAQEALRIGLATRIARAGQAFNEAMRLAEELGTANTNRRLEYIKEGVRLCWNQSPQRAEQRAYALWERYAAETSGVCARNGNGI